MSRIEFSNGGTTGLGNLLPLTKEYVSLKTVPLERMQAIIADVQPGEQPTGNLTATSITEKDAGRTA